ncbi:MAG: dependent oxidoreductase [Clostridia bacterium]|nr:dependent oxidoreductase [Clostridia bacterium]
MELELKNIKLPIENRDNLNEMDQLKYEAAKKLKLKNKDIQAVKIIKKSVDARKKDDIMFVYSIAVSLKTEISGVFINDKDVFDYNPEKYVESVSGSEAIENRPIIIGSGPAGLFCGLLLAERGYKPLILERGKDVDSRTKEIDAFWKGGGFSEESNVQFGEGGAGTFSDGKLTTRIKDSRCDLVIQKFVEAGAPEEISYINKPHIGTDILKVVVKNLRNRIIELGGEVRFNAKVTDLVIVENKCKGVVVNNTESIDSNIILAALGHSARDTYKMFFDKGVSIAQKAFSIGLRIEHHQSMINEVQQGKLAGNASLGAADYVLTFRSETTGRSAYSFCMCPGGAVVAAASEAGMVVTNGMSEYARDLQNANSALVVSVSPEDFGSTHPLAGIEYQRTWERKAFEAGGGNYRAPVQQVGDFLAGKPSCRYGAIKPSYTPGVRLTDMHLCLPDYVTTTLKEAIKNFDRKIKGFARKDALLTGVETRTSAPIRIVRKENMESENIDNLYPIGEGAGYAGGIISAAVDGIKAAEKIIGRFEPIK